MFGQKRNGSQPREFFLGDLEAQDSAQVRSAEAEEKKAPQKEKPRFDAKKFLSEKTEQGKTFLSEKTEQGKSALSRAKDSALKAKEEWSTAAKEKADEMRTNLQRHREETARAREEEKKKEEQRKKEELRFKAQQKAKKEAQKAKKEAEKSPAPTEAPTPKTAPEKASEWQVEFLNEPKKAPTGKNLPQKEITPPVNQSVDLSETSLADFLRQGGKAVTPKVPVEEALPTPQKTKKEASVFKKRKKAQEEAKKEEAFLNAEDTVKASLDGMYGVYSDPKKAKKKTLSALDYLRYGILFICIFGFFLAGYFVFDKLYDYYRSYVTYSRLQQMVTQKDYFAGEYLKKATSSIETLTPAEVLAGKTPQGSQEGSAFTEAQETLVGKIGQLKKINADTTGWITIKGTVVNYPLVWSSKRNYYLHRDFYGKTLSGGAIFMDERNDPDLTKNRNTVIYGHNMSDGSMFASIHDFASASVFFGSTIEIATQEGIYVYTPFSVHRSNAFDNYFETNFVSDDDFINFCEQMAFLSIYETDTRFNKNSQIITLSTCMDNEVSTEERFAVHAILTQVIR
ncbi:MAG: sortase [Clostridia bacterium]|nr:sortase [Clostridia bacterium]